MTGGPQSEDGSEHCTEFTTDHGLDETETEAGTFYFAFVCPGARGEQCGTRNALKGDPRDFKTKPFRCIDCDWVSLLDADALERFATEHYDGTEVAA